MKAKLLIFTILITTTTKAQTHRFFYQLKSKIDSTQSLPVKDIMVLDVNPDKTKYYDIKLLEQDSINEINKSEITNWTENEPIVRKKHTYINLNYHSVNSTIYVYPTEDFINWNITNETKSYLNYVLQKATTTFGGRFWTAWFTKKIPYPEGPYKFKGLPGLIVLLHDSNYYYNFSLIKEQLLDKTYNTANIIENRYNNKPIVISEKTYVKKAIEHFKDPYKNIRKGFGNKTIKGFENEGKVYTTADELMPLIKIEQFYLIKYNNLIEKNKSINYPQISETQNSID